MKIAVTATGPSLDAAVDPRFGRCACFMIVEPDSLAFTAVANANAALGGGAGVQSAELMAEKEVGLVLTGSCGPKASRALSAAGIEVILGCSGTVRDVVEQYKSGKLAPGGGADAGRGLGQGRGS